MTFLNTVKIVMANFSAVWKLLLYYIICAAVLFTVLYFAVSPVFDALKSAGVFQDLLNMINSVFTGSSVATQTDNAFSKAFSVLSSNVDMFAFHYVLIMLMLFIIIPFCFGLAELAIGEVLYGYMSSQTKYGFTRSFIGKVGKSCLLQLTKLLLLLPVNIIVILEVYGILHLLAIGGIGLIFAAFLIILMTIVTLALKDTLFSCWMPAMLILDIGPFKALRKSMGTVSRRFLKIFSTNLVLVLIMFSINLFFGLFTLLIAMVITIPLTTFVFTVSNMVEYFTGQGMKFYVTQGIVCEPKRMEEQDGIVRLKKIV
ncbi:MAG: hypothetical protein LBN07_02480 [Christensenellaceae bacterium]|jgi:hypothetical protein|nr:hypothetical protein [Christensenellaceae bacterium]